MRNRLNYGLVFAFFSVSLFVCAVSFTAHGSTGAVNLSPLQGPGGKWGYADPSGAFIISPKFEKALPFSDGLALISVWNKFGYINEKGFPVLKPQYDGARSFSEGLAAVMVVDLNNERKWGYIDRTGRFIIPPRFEEASDFSGGKATVKMDGDRITIDRAGAVLSR